MSKITISHTPITYGPVSVSKKHKFFGWLPPEQQFGFEFCFFLHDQIASLATHGEQEEAFDHNLNIDNIPEDIEDGQLIEWLMNNGHIAEACLITYKVATLGLISDMTHFIYEALDCARKLKITVSYSLLRRPLKDNLHFLEFMLADTGEFIKQFNLRDEKSIDPVESFTKERKIELISQAMQKYKNKFPYSPELIYDLRYDKSCPYGLERFFQHSLHLITSFKEFKTGPCNFNFIFPEDGFQHERLELLFASLPLLLIHTLYLLLELISLFSPFEDGPIAKSLDARTRLGFILWYKKMNYSDFFNLSGFKLSPQEIYNLFPQDILECSKCHHRMKPTERLMLKFFRTATVKCSKCKSVTFPFGEYD